MPRVTPVVVCLVDAGIVATAALALLTTLDPGLRVPLGFLTLSVNSPIRPALIALTLAALRLRWPPPTRSSLTSTHLLLASLAAASVGYWLRYLTTVSGGADSYGYISAAGLLADGRLITPQPDAAWLPAANAIAALSPLGYTPYADTTSIVPLYPLGYPALVALTAAIVPVSIAPYLVTPVLGILVLVLVYRIAIAWTGSATTAWLSTALVAWDALFITYAKQPMSDVPATAFVLTAVWCLTPTTPAPLLAGLSAGVAFPHPTWRRRRDCGARRACGLARPARAAVAYLVRRRTRAVGRHPGPVAVDPVRQPVEDRLRIAGRPVCRRVRCRQRSHLSPGAGRHARARVGAAHAGWTLGCFGARQPGGLSCCWR